jgi:RNA polymerase sigma factor (sigma-70 family)
MLNPEWGRRRPPKFATIRRVPDSSRELLQEGRQPDGGAVKSGQSSMEQVYQDLLPIIGKLAAHACRRYAFSREEVEDFTQEAKLKIWENGCAVLRKHQGRSKLTSYLAVVVQHALLDYVYHRWGKWRPSEAAKRHGRLGVQLEKLLVCDRLSFPEACQTLWTNFHVTAGEAELQRIAAELPVRLPRRAEGRSEGAAGAAGRHAGGPAGEPAAVETADERLWSREIARQKQEVFRALRAALATLPEAEQLIARCLLDGLSVVQIARSWQLDQKRLYKKCEKILKKLRKAMERAGISATDVAEVLERVDV